MIFESFHPTYCVVLFKLHGRNLTRRMCSFLRRDILNSSKYRFYDIRIDFKERRKINTRIIHKEKERELMIALSFPFPSPIKYWLKCLFYKLFVAACSMTTQTILKKILVTISPFKKNDYKLHRSKLETFMNSLWPYNLSISLRIGNIVKSKIDRIKIVPSRLRA